MIGAYLSLSLPVLILAATLQSSFATQLRVFGGSPDLVLMIVVSWAIESELDEALTWAFVGGIVQDLLSAAPLGTSSLGLILIVGVVHLIRRQVFTIGWPGVMLVAGVGTLIKETVFALVMAFTGMGSNYLYLFSYVILPTAVYNFALVFVVFGVVRFVQRGLWRNDRRYALRQQTFVRRG
ncbi:MAG: rod shape-determining protein MreD [Phototrophicaceae bacterium]|jgi:rod shape-determining protein MreD